MLSKMQKKKLLEALKEDIAKGDITSNLLKPKKSSAFITAKEQCILAGIEEASFLFKSKGLKVKSLKKDGNKAKKGEKIMEINGLNKSILAVERTALNFLARMSGIATACSYAQKIAGKNTLIALTRKTAPLLNSFDKKAGMIAGIYPHRINLSSGILIKDNHLAFESIENIVRKARKKGYKNIEVECSNLHEVNEAIKANADIIMLDNFSVKEARKAVKKIREKSKAMIELSGNINFNNLKAYSKLRPDMISLGMLTHSVKAINFNLTIKR